MLNWLKIPFLGEVKTVIKSQFGGLGLNVTLHLGPVVLFLTDARFLIFFLGFLFTVIQEKVIVLLLESL